MFTDTSWRLATAESISGINSGASAIMANSVTAALDPSGVTPYLRNLNEIGGAENLSLSINVTTAFTSGTFGASLEFQLISIPISPTLLTAVTGGRTSVAITGVAVTSATPGIFTINGHGLPLGTPIYLTSIATTTGISNNTVYYVVPQSANTFAVAATLAQAIAATPTLVATGTGAGTATVNFIPTVHATTGSQLILGTPSTAGIFGVIGNRVIAPLIPLHGPTPKMAVPTGQTLRVPIGTAQQGQLASNANQFYVMRFLASNAITAGAVTIDLVTDAGAAMKHYGSGFEVL